MNITNTIMAKRPRTFNLDKDIRQALLDRAAQTNKSQAQIVREALRVKLNLKNS